MEGGCDLFLFFSMAYYYQKKKRDLTILKKLRRNHYLIHFFLLSAAVGEKLWDLGIFKKNEATTLFKKEEFVGDLARLL